MSESDGNPSFFSTSNFYALIITGAIFILGLLKSAFTISDLKKNIETQLKEQNEKIDSVKTEITSIKTTIESAIDNTDRVLGEIKDHAKSVTDLEKKVMIMNVKIEYSEQKIKDGLNFIYNRNKNDNNQDNNKDNN